MLGADDTEKLVKILGMTQSDHDGEALAALRKAQAIMVRARVGWRDLVARQQVSRPTRPTWPPQPQWDGEEASLLRDGLEALHDYPAILTDWERGFLKDWETRNPSWGMSEKQKAVFVRIKAKLEMAKRRER
jgi:hypothetical protein